MTAPQQTGPVLRHSPWLALITIALGYFMNVLDSTVVNVALPNIMTDLAAPMGHMLWVVNGYLLPYAMLLLLAGRLGDLLGHRAVFAFGLGVFVVASLLCSLSATPEQLIASRVLQGIGAGVAGPQALAITAAVFPAHRRGMAFGVLASIIGTAAAIGPFLGGLITHLLDWRWIFLMNLPIGVAGLICTFVFVPKTRVGGRPRLAFLPVVLATAGLFGVLYALIDGPRVDWGEIVAGVHIGYVFIVGLVIFFGFVYWEWSRTDGLLPRALFANRNYGLMAWASLATYFCIFGTQLAMTLYLQSVLHVSALEAGLVLSPMWLASSLVAPFSGALMQRVQPRWILVGGFAAFCLGTVLTALLITPQMPWGVFVATLLLAGAGAGFTFAPLTTVAMSEVPPHEVGGASGTLEMARMLGSAVCTAVVGAILGSTATSSAAALAADSRAALLVTALVVAVAVVTSLFLKRGGLPAPATDAGEQQLTTPTSATAAGHPGNS
ncbi:DHA2 family efflux MFS transporter permease subunit [Nonomuraea sp. KC401]|uniref:DHA2 family efflux MFS transporter permease subunit n=1 Tax=unclassified Nonomuraea TaxID=2593643 RepID=UPI0010FD931B|nr:MULTISPECIES: DHA2 family efflux MFS transporter permease subunit [unclassified Nonomuraea]NBE96557.1 DHA2 family efflux MFS transporter permease subunit [Nonomuraea sp. K271]TLF86341.1 DHA2 family efflux MFS transporter permease subunit [Nonomuraea sp. KC401]